MSRGHGKVERWLLEKGLSEELRSLSEIGHLWVLHLEGIEECDGSHACCDMLRASHAQRESIRRAIKKLEAEPGSRVYWDTTYRCGEQDVVGELIARLLSPLQKVMREAAEEDLREQMRARGLDPGF